MTCGGENPAYGERRRATRYRQSALEKVATFNDFNEGNDPHQERDYGSFDHSREFWFKSTTAILKLEMASPDPADLILLLLSAS